jgi:hypothetical protein
MTKVCAEHDPRERQRSKPCRPPVVTTILSSVHTKRGCGGLLAEGCCLQLLLKPPTGGSVGDRGVGIEGNKQGYANSRRRTAPAMPTKPVPNRAILPGSGTVDI